jgi:hypothetical protein
LRFLKRYNPLRPSFGTPFAGKLLKLATPEAEFPVSGVATATGTIA